MRPVIGSGDKITCSMGQHINVTLVSPHQYTLFIGQSSRHAMCFTSADNEELRLQSKLESIRLRAPSLFLLDADFKFER